ncbi:MAG: SsrA-binding protein, partial [Candidatus Jacksonbacteria bacterium]|nr:SsrA-binding protein [Candidatus Jacksonbacteria bacterium]
IPTRPRKLLLNKRELSSLVGKLKTKGFTLLALRVFTTRGFIKVEIGIGRGKKQHDKREEKKNKDIARDVKRELRNK